MRRMVASSAGVIGFGQQYLAAKFTAPPAAMHYDMERLWLQRTPLVGIVGPSDSAKSTLARAMVLREALVEPEFLFGLFVGPTQGIAREMLAPIKRELENNELLIEDYYRLRCDRWSSDAIEIRKPNRPGATCLLAVLSPGMEVRGWLHHTVGMSVRPQLVLDDDSERRLEAGSEALIRSYEAFLWDSLLPRLDWSAGKARVWRLGNLANERSSLGKMFAGVRYTDPRDGSTYGPGDDARAVAYGDWTRRRYDCYMPDGSSYWPERWSMDALEESRLRLAHQVGAWERQYRQQPFDPATVVFDYALLSRERAYGPAPADGADARQRYPGIAIYGAIDPAIRQKSSSDYTALVTVGRTRDGLLLVLDATWQRVGVSAQLDLVFDGNARWRWDLLAVETVAYQEALNQLLIEQARAGRGDVRTEPIHTHTDKHLRIVGLQPLLRDGTLQLAVEHDALRTEICGYRPKQGHDDVLDALEMAVSIARKGGLWAAPKVEPEGPRRDRPREWYRQSPKLWRQ